MYWIHKNGEQSGPYPAEQLAAMVRQSILQHEDLCWKEGWAEWRSLASVFMIPAPIQPKGVDAESEIFSGTPSLLPVVFTALGWGLVILILLFAGLLIQSQAATVLLVVGGLFLGLLQVGIQVLRIKTTRYFISTSRIKITFGILNRRVDEIELHRIQDTSLFQKLIYRLFHLGDIQVVSVDRTDPYFVLSRIKNAEQIREKLRTAILQRRKNESIREVQVF